MLCGSLGDSSASGTQLRRQKRDWVVPTTNLKENYDYRKHSYIAKIRSDMDKKHKLHYSLLGHGANKDPINLFVVDTIGLVYVRGILDREKQESYTLIGLARFDNGSIAEEKIEITFAVEDENDNPPVFAPAPPAEVYESSPAGTLVGRVTATDADKTGTNHTRIAYSIAKQEPFHGEHLFYIDKTTGSIYVKEETLDREKQSSYILTIKGTDMGGDPGGKTGNGTILVKLLDINDNTPSLDKDEYSASIKENIANVEVLRFQVLDADEDYNINWMAVFNIVSGNEEGIFSVRTDPKTNEGVLMLVKPADFEENPNIQLGVVNCHCHVIAPCSHRYAKGYDPDNWLVINPETAEVRLQKTPDRESPFLVNGTYYAEILSLSNDMPSKTATGTLALQVGDTNDNCPTLIDPIQKHCSYTEVVNIIAEDEDGDPNSAPFTFNFVDEKSMKKWRVEPLNGTSISLRALEPLWPGYYEVPLIIKDQQGFACSDQVLKLHVFPCEDKDTALEVSNGTLNGFSEGVLRKASSTLSGVGIGAVILGLLTLLVIVLLLITCSCGAVPMGFSELPFDTIDHLMIYHTEGRGEDKDVPLLSSPVQMTHPVMASVKLSKAGAIPRENIPSLMTLNYGNTYTSNGMIQELGYEESRERDIYFSALEEHDAQYDISLPDMFLYQYYSQKVNCAVEKQAASDCLLGFEYEGSSDGSLDTYNLMEFDDDLQFLDDLGPKFKTLADLCSPPRPPMPLAAESIVIQQVDTVDNIVVPSLETKQLNIHSETLEDHLNVSVTQSSTSHMHGQSISTPVIPSAVQTIVLQQQQQPVYYTATPVVQQMHYMVQPQLQSTVMLQAPVNNLQGMILVNGHSGYAEHILQGGNTSGTSTVIGTRLGRLSEGNQRVGICSRSEGSGAAKGVKKSSQIKSEGGAKAEWCHTNIGMLPAAKNITLIGGQIGLGTAGYGVGQVVFTEGAEKSSTLPILSAETGGQVGVGAAGYGVGQVVITERAKKKKTLPIAPAQTGGHISVGAAGYGVGQVVVTEIAGKSRNHSIASDGIGGQISVGAAGYGVGQVVVTEIAEKSSNQSIASAETGGHISVGAAGYDVGPVVFTEITEKSINQSTASTETGRQFSVGAAGYGVGQVVGTEIAEKSRNHSIASDGIGGQISVGAAGYGVGQVVVTEIAEKSRNHSIASDGIGGQISVGAAGYGVGQVVVTEIAEKSSNQSIASAETGGHISVGAAGYDVGPVVFTEITEKSINQSTASTETGRQFSVGAAGYGVGQVVGTEIAEKSRNHSNASDGIGGQISVGAVGYEVGQVVVTEIAEKSSNQSIASAETGGHISVGAAGYDVGPVVFTEITEKSINQSNASTETGRQFSVGAAGYGVEQVVVIEIAEKSHNQSIASDTTGGQIGVGAAGYGVGQVVVTEIAEKSSNQSIASAETGGHISVGAAGYDVGPVVFTEITEESSPQPTGFTSL
ncbi:desmoglein-2-like protein [Scomber scombrus]|uniref:Desmoglein-2-like protein n=1 Tax=Scomber scombrus TaxID=13677 RepID=A0AAV1PE78_SCOSC